MANPARSRWVREHPIAGATLLVAAGAAAALLATRAAPAELDKALYTAAVALVFTALLGGIVKLLMDDVAAARKRQEDATGFVANVLRDLKGVYDRVGRVRIVIPAHRSVKTYGEEMRDAIDARVQLRNVIRALEQRPDLPSGLRAAVKDQVCRMEDYLESLTAEFRDHYKALSDQQSVYEAARKKDPPGDAPDPWLALQALPQLGELVQGGDRYQSLFEGPLDEATRLLRGELARLMGFPAAAPGPRAPDGAGKG